jgi:hypothetical protein
MKLALYLSVGSLKALILSTEEGIDRENKLRKRLGSDRLAPLQGVDDLIAIRGWMSVHLQVLRGHVEQPGLRHPGPGIDGQFDLAVCYHRGIGYFDDQIDGLRLRMRARIEIGARSEQRHIRLGL